MGQRAFVGALAERARSEGLSQNGLARRVGTTGAAISRWFGGSRAPSAEAQRRVLRAYPDLLAYLLMPDDEPTRVGSGRGPPAAPASERRSRRPNGC